MGETSGENISIGVIQPHGADEVIGWNLKTFKFRAGLHQFSPFFDDELEIFNL